MTFLSGVFHHRTPRTPSCGASRSRVSRRPPAAARPAGLQRDPGGDARGGARSPGGRPPQRQGRQDRRLRPGAGTYTRTRMNTHIHTHAHTHARTYPHRTSKDTSSACKASKCLLSTFSTAIYHRRHEHVPVPPLPTAPALPRRRHVSFTCVYVTVDPRISSSWWTT